MKRIITILLLAGLAGGSVPARATAAEGPKDTMTAFLLSFIVPGLGQYYAGSFGAGKRYIAAELAIWGGYYYNISMKAGRRQDYVTQAALHAGATLSDAPASYINAVGAYASSFDYNHRMLQREYNPVQYEGDLAWNWDDPAERARFKKLRESELNYKNYAKYCIAGVILNHFLAGLNATHIARSMNEQSSLTVDVLNGGGLGATFTRRF